MDTMLTRGSAYVVDCDILNLFDSFDCSTLATQAWKGRYLKVDENESNFHKNAIQITLVEDGYKCWLLKTDLKSLKECSSILESIPSSILYDEIQLRLPDVLKFALETRSRPNQYLWGGTVGPNFDCSGLVQRAFSSVGVWIPRDAYQQEAFSQAIGLSDAKEGDLIFFGKTKATHVGLCTKIILKSKSKEGKHSNLDANLQKFLKVRKGGGGGESDSSENIQIVDMVDSNASASADASAARNICTDGMNEYERGDGLSMQEKGKEKEEHADTCDGLVMGDLELEIEYIHSSGRDHGNDGVGLNRLSPLGKVNGHYFLQYRGIGRIMKCWH